MENETIPSGDDQVSEETPQSPVENPPNSPADEGGGKVAYESYKKLLSEKKRTQGELEKLKMEFDRRQQEELESQQKYKELWESTKTEADSLREKLQSHEERWDDARKLDAFHKALGDTKKIDSKYAGFIDTSKILIDPETQKIDPLSAKKEVERVVNSFPEIVHSTVTAQMPNQNPSAGSTLTYDQWLKLPAKEMAARRKEVTD